MRLGRLDDDDEQERAELAKRLAELAPESEDESRRRDWTYELAPPTKEDSNGKQ